MARRFLSVSRLRVFIERHVPFFFGQLLLKIRASLQ